MSVSIERVDVNGITLEFTDSGTGPAVLLVHGFPHTRDLWHDVAPALARDRRVIALDTRGIGGSTRIETGYDVITLAADLHGLLDTLQLEHADVVAIDAGGPPAFVLAVQHPDRVRRLVLMESTLGVLPGAEDFFRAGAPWWFGFHQAPALAESVLVGHEGEYLDFFLRSGTWSGAGIDPEVRDAFVAAYSGTESLRCAFTYYRAMPKSSEQLAILTRDRRLTVPTLAVGARPVGRALHRQLEPLTDDLQGEIIEECGHIIPLDRPDALVPMLRTSSTSLEVWGRRIWPKRHASSRIAGPAWAVHLHLREPVSPASSQRARVTVRSRRTRVNGRHRRANSSGRAASACAERDAHSRAPRRFRICWTTSRRHRSDHVGAPYASRSSRKNSIKS